MIIAGVLVALVIVVMIIMHFLEHNVVTRADSLTPGMTTNQVREIMGNPKRISPRSSSSYYEEWHYDVPGQTDFSLSLKPFRFSLWQRDWITINFDPDGKVSSVWIPSQLR